MKTDIEEKSLEKIKGKQEFVSVKVILDGCDKTYLFFNKKQSSKISKRRFELFRERLRWLFQNLK